MSWLGSVLLVASVAAGAPQRQAQTPAGDSTPGSELTVYLLTFDPGDLVWERFGHNALWIRDQRNHTDYAYDYGRFSFGRTWSQKMTFFGRFAVADLLYSMGDGDVRGYLAAYTGAGRSIWSQELDLPPAARASVRDFLLWNIREENKSYQYNYYLDNCSTRIRDIIDRAVNGQLKRWADSVTTPFTYRDQTRRTTENSALVYTALMLGLGQPVDHRLSAWEEMFLPISLRPFLDQFRVTDPDGRVHPLVKEQRHLVESDRFSVASTPSNWLYWYLLIGVVAGAVLVGLGKLGRSSTRWRLAFGAVSVGWALFAGIGGITLAALWGFTAHRFSYWNENLFQLNLLSLLLAMVLPTAIWRGQSRWRLGLRLATAVALIGGVGLVLKLLPGFRQDNLDMIALLLPIHLGLLGGLKAMGAGPSA